MFIKKLFRFFCVALLASGLSASAFAAAERGSPDEAMAMVKKAVAFAKGKGKDKLLAEVSNPKGQFIDRDLYLSVYDFNGTVLAHGTNPKLIGKDVSGLKDGDGSWAAMWEQRSKERGKPEHIPGWKAGDYGSTIENPPHMALAGPWTNGQPPRAAGG